MKFSPNLCIDTVAIHEPQEDALWTPGALLGSVRVELVERTGIVQSAASASSSAEIAATRLSVARCHRSSLPQAGRLLLARGRTYRIESVIEERDGVCRYQTLVLKEVQ